MASNATVAAAFTAGAVISAIVVRQYYRCLAAELARIKEEPPLALPCADPTSSRPAVADPPAVAIPQEPCALPNPVAASSSNETSLPAVSPASVITAPAQGWDEKRGHETASPAHGPARVAQNAPTATPTSDLITASVVTAPEKGWDEKRGHEAAGPAHGPARVRVAHEPPTVTPKNYDLQRACASPPSSEEACSIVATAAGVQSSLGGGRKNPSLVALDRLVADHDTDEPQGSFFCRRDPPREPSFASSSSYLVERPRAALYGKLGSKSASRLASRAASRGASTSASFQRKPKAQDEGSCSSSRCASTSSCAVVSSGSFDGGSPGASSADRSSPAKPTPSKAASSVLGRVAENMSNFEHPIEFRPPPPRLRRLTSSDDPEPQAKHEAAAETPGEAPRTTPGAAVVGSDDSSPGGGSEEAEDETSFTQSSPKSQTRYWLLAEEEQRFTLEADQE